jgi:glutaredoxin 3
MGRITIFSLDDCAHCQGIKAAFEQRNVPYLEISLSKHPQKRNDMLSLTDRFTVPQVFLNQTLIGGADETLKVLKTWDSDPQMTPMKYYESFVSKSSDPTDPRLQPSTDPPVVEPPAPPRREEKPILLPDFTFLSVLEMTEWLKSILPRKDLNYKLTSYKNSFKADQAVDILHKLLMLASREEAVEFGNVLQKHRILDHVVSEHEFADTSSLFFRLQCYQTPNILNSYRIWTEKRQEQVPEQSPDLSNMALLNRLKKMLNRMISDHTDSDRKINYKQVALHNDFPAFEEAVCELQIVDFFSMTHEAKLVR